MGKAMNSIQSPVMEINPADQRSEKLRWRRVVSILISLSIFASNLCYNNIRMVIFAIFKIFLTYFIKICQWYSVKCQAIAMICYFNERSINRSHHVNELPD